MSDPYGPGGPGGAGVPGGPPAGWTPPGPPAVSQDERTMGALAHGLGFFVSFIAPLVVYLTRDRSDFAKFAAAQALNFTITVAIAYAVSGVLVFALVGIVLLPVVAVWSFVLAVIATVRTAQGEWYRYPLTIPFIRT